MRTEPKGGSASHSVVSPWTVARQAPLSTGFSRKNTRVGSHFLLQEIFLTQRLKPDLLHYRQILNQLSHPGVLKEGVKIG